MYIAGNTIHFNVLQFRVCASPVHRRAVQNQSMGSPWAAFTLATLEGLRFMKGTHGTAVNSVVFRAPLVETNIALASIKVTPGKDFVGKCMLTLRCKAGKGGGDENWLI